VCIVLYSIPYGKYAYSQQRVTTWLVRRFEPSITSQLAGCMIWPVYVEVMVAWSIPRWPRTVINQAGRIFPPGSVDNLQQELKLHDHLQYHVYLSKLL
jgi:hypothetical protein